MSVRFGDKDYALVPDRLKQFREDSPRASIKTKPTWHEDGSLDFTAYIVKDKSDEYSADATGTAHYSVEEMKPKKAFEKLETISIGRALAVLGYLNDGQIASSEEMQEFIEYKDNKLELAIDTLLSAETIDDLKSTFLSLGKLMAEPDVIKAKNDRKAVLSESTKVRN